MHEEKTMLIEVAYATAAQQVIIPLQVTPGITLIDAIKLSGVLEQFPDIDLDVNKFGVFSKISKADTVLREKDRVEIYRKLIADPKESRRKRAEKKKNQEEPDNTDSASAV